MNTAKLYIYNLLAIFMPPSRFYGLKRRLLRWAGASIGENVRVVSTARFHLTGRLEIGENSYIGDYVLIAGGDATVRIGSNVSIGPRCTLVTGSHELYTEPGIAAGRGYSHSINIKDGVWLGASSTVLAGVTIGRASVIAAGGVVIDEILDSSVVGGVPARPLGKNRQ